MSVSPWSFAIGLACLIVYSVAYVLKKRKRPNLGSLFVLFLIGPVVMESLAVISIFFRFAVEKQQLDFGVLKDHVFVVAFTGIALLYAAADQLVVTFKELGATES